MKQGLMLGHVMCLYHQIRCLPYYVTYIDLTPSFSGLGKHNCKTRRDTYKFGDLVHLILETLRYGRIRQHDGRDKGQFKWFVQWEYHCLATQNASYSYRIKATSFIRNSCFRPCTSRCQKRHIIPIISQSYKICMTHLVEWNCPWAITRFIQ